MTALADADRAALSDPALAAWLCAIDPVGLGGIAVRGRGGPLRDRWLALLRGLLPADMPMRRLPLHADDHRIFGGLDLAATLAAGRPVAERGVLAETDGGLLVLSMAERVPPAKAARLGAVLDAGVVTLERDGLAGRLPARIAVVAFDEGIEPDEQVSSILLDRLAFRIDLDDFDPASGGHDGSAIVAEARRLYPQVRADEASLRMLAETALALGVWSLRVSVLALRVACAAAALAGREAVGLDEAALAARLVLAPRATRLPADEPPEASAETAPPQPQDAGDQPAEPKAEESGEDRDGETRPDKVAEDLVLAAAKAAIPPGLLERLQAEALRGNRSAPGRAGGPQASGRRGRPAGTRQGTPGAGARLDVIATLRAAAPWQRLRVSPAGVVRRVEIRHDDLRITRFKQRTETTTVFVVDASGSLALNRLAEAKGAVELLLAECYVRRDQVALLAFRGATADLLLPPTRSLARAKRSLADLPGGGGTPLATAIDAAVLTAEQIRRRGQNPVVVLLTDGRGNVARDGTAGRARAEEDVRLAARAAAASGVRMLVVDASSRPHPAARALAADLRALYVPLPRVEAGALSRAVLAATTG